MGILGEIKKTPADWDAYYFRIAMEVATGSKDPNRKVGALVVTPDRRQVSFGFNGFPAGMPDLKEHLKDQEFKRAHMVHAEDNAIQQAPFFTVGCTLYVTRFPCHHCADKVATAKIARVVAPVPDLDHPAWGASWQEALNIFGSAGIQVTTVNVIEQ